MSDDLEKAVLFAYDPSGVVEKQLKAQAQAYLEGVQRSSDIWTIAIERLESSAYPEVQFWALQTLRECVDVRYDSLSPLEASQLKTRMMSWLPQQGTSPPFIRNKMAQLLVAVLTREYPERWPSFFSDVLSLLGQGPAPVDMFVRIMDALHEDVISLEVPRSQSASRASMHMKDAMRDQCLRQVSAAWFSLVVQYGTSMPELAAAVLRSMQNYVGWVDIGLVANDDMIPALLRCLEATDAPDLQAAAADCLAETLCKRMEPLNKLALIQKLGIVPAAAQWLPVMPTEDPELAANFAKLLCSLATEVMEAWKRFENSMSSMQAIGLEVHDDARQEAAAACAAASDMMAAMFPAVVGTLHSSIDGVATAALPFLSAYVARLKIHARNNASCLTPQVLEHTGAILGGVAAALAYPADFDPAAPDRATQEEEVLGKRPELQVLYRSLAKVVSEQATQDVHARLQSALGAARSGAPGPTWQAVEVAVLLLYDLGEACAGELQAPHCGKLRVLALTVVGSPSVPHATHPLVAVPVMEVCVRFVKMVCSVEGLLPAVISTFLDGRGMGHPSEVVSRRACYLLTRIVKPLRQALTPYIPEMLDNIRPRLAAIATTPELDFNASLNKKDPAARAQAAVAAVVDDRLYAFDAVGLLVGQDALIPGDQEAFLRQLLTPLVDQIEEELALVAADGDTQACSHPGAPPRWALIQQALEAIARVSKGFRSSLVTKQRPVLGEMFQHALAASIRVGQELGDCRSLRARVTAFLHRMVECLSEGALPQLPLALQVLWRSCRETPDYIAFIVFVNQLLAHFKTDLAPTLQSLLPTLISRIHEQLGPDWDWSTSTERTAGPSASATGTTEELREKTDLQKAYYSHLHTIAHQDLAFVLIGSPDSLQLAISALVQGGRNHCEASIRKLCIMTMQQLVKLWMPPSPAAPTPGLSQFAQDSFGVCTLIQGLGQPGLDCRDASTMALLTEVAAALQLLHLQYQDEFLRQVAAPPGLPSLGLSTEQQQAFLQAMQTADPKRFRGVLKEVVMQQSKPAAVATKAGVAGR